MCSLDVGQNLRSVVFIMNLAEETVTLNREQVDDDQLSVGDNCYL
jgi:hypothetical protein